MYVNIDKAVFLWGKLVNFLKKLEDLLVCFLVTENEHNSRWLVKDQLLHIYFVPISGVSVCQIEEQ